MALILSTARAASASISSMPPSPVSTCTTGCYHRMITTVSTCASGYEHVAMMRGRCCRLIASGEREITWSALLRRTRKGVPRRLTRPNTDASIRAVS